MKSVDSMRAVRRWLSVLLAIATVSAGCKSGGDNATAEPTVPTSGTTSSSTTATTGVADVATIPDVIDEPYINGVLAALDKVDTTAVRVVMETKNVPPEAAEIFNSIYNDEWFTIKVDSWLGQVQRDPELKGLRRPLGDRHTTVQRLIAASPACVWMSVTRDYSESNANPQPPRTEYLALQPLDPSNDPKDHNPTAWMITADGFNEDGSEPQNECPNA